MRKCMCEQALEMRKRIETLENMLRAFVEAEENGEFTEGGEPWHLFKEAFEVLGEG